MADQDLTSVEHVKLAMGATSAGSDDRIAFLITAASDAIRSWSGREWIGPTDPEARSFTVGDVRPVWIGDLQAVPDEVTLEAADGTEIGTLTPADHLTYLPAGRPAGEPIEAIDLRSGAPLVVSPGEVLVITGLWGWPEVPPRAEQACIVTVRSWLRSDASSSANYGYDDGGRVVQATPEGGWMLPIAAKQLLSNDRRRGVA